MYEQVELVVRVVGDLLSPPLHRVDAVKVRVLQREHE